MNATTKTEATNATCWIARVEGAFDATNADDVDFIVFVGQGFFAAGQAGAEQKIRVFENIHPSNMERVERSIKAAAPFIANGGAVVFYAAEGDQIPAFRWVVRDGKAVKEFARIAWGGGNEGKQQNQNRQG